MWALNVAARLLNFGIRVWSRYHPRVSDGVAGASNDLLAALQRARGLVADPNTDGAFLPGGTLPHSRPPWNAPAADAVYDVSAAARRLERTLRAEVTGTTARRGGSDANTDEAITALPALTEAIPRDRAREVGRKLGRWTLRFLRLRDIDEAILWQPIRMRPGSTVPPVCPYCRTPNLRASDRSSVVMCFYPDCPGDANGTVPAFARLEVSARRGAVILTGDDGTEWAIA